MVNLVITFLAALAGYLLVVLLVWAGTMTITASAPQMVAGADHRLRPAYKAAQQGLWLVCVLLGAFVTAWVGMHVNQKEQEIALLAALLFVLWRNTWEARQRGTAAQILISILTVIGVIGGFALENAVIHK